MTQNVSLEDMSFKRMINKKKLDKRIKKIAKEINKEYKGQFLDVIIVLKGAFVFGADLVRNLKVDHAVHFVQFSSYEGTKSTNKIKEKLPLILDVKNRNLLIVEDIIDTGNTLKYFIGKLDKKNPKSLNIVSLLFKPKAFKHDYEIKFKAFEIENQFVIGYGMDLDEKARHLKHIYQLDE